MSATELSEPSQFDWHQGQRLLATQSVNDSTVPTVPTIVEGTGTKSSLARRGLVGRLARGLPGMKSLKPYAPAATPTAAAPRPHPLIASILAHHAANSLPVTTAQQQPRLTRSQAHHKYLLSTLAPWLSKTYSTEAAAAARGRVFVPPQGTHARNTGRRSNDGLLAERHETDRHHKRLSRALLMDMNELLIRGGGKGPSGSRTPKEWDAWWLRFVAWMAVARALHRKTLLTVLTHPFGMLSRPHGPHIPVPATLAHIVVSSFLALLSIPDLTREQTAMCRYIAAAGRDLVLLLMSLLTEEAGDEELEVMETFASALFKGLSDREKCQGMRTYGPYQRRRPVLTKKLIDSYNFDT
ncbi:hypothetical protein HDU89_004068 [Geranomyces variabilis]|nr:hypothetical protein HDU89_004068 [Geranomyces variabilis]